MGKEVGKEVRGSGFSWGRASQWAVSKVVTPSSLVCYFIEGH